MEKLSRSSALRYSAPIIAVGLALFLTLQVELLAARTPYALFFAAVMVSARYGGMKSGLLAIALSVLVSDYFVIPPRDSFLPNRNNILQVITFASVALLINFLTTARQRSQQSLSESEERYRLLFDSNPLPLWVYDLETLAFLAVNEAAVRGYGYSRAEFLAMTIKDIRPAEDVPDLLKVVSNVSKGLDAAGMWRHRKKDGTLIDVEITSHTLDFAGRRAELVQAHDITERKRAEEAREQLASIVESSDDAIISKTLQGRITSWNASAEKTYGYTAAEATGQHITFIMPPERYNELAEIIERVRQGEGVKHLETVRIRKDGKRVDVSISVSPIRDATGQVVGASTIARDITERKRAEEALRTSEERYRSLVLTTSQLVWTADAQGSVTSVTNLQNSLGQEQDLSGWNWVDTIHPDDRERAVRQWTEAVQSQTPLESEYRQIHEDGSHHYWIARGIPIRGEDGRVREWIGTSNDITERKQAEAKLQAKSGELAALTQQFWQASKLAIVGELAASIAHELNNPLATVSLRTESLLVQLDEDAPQRRALEIIAQEVERMGSLVGNLLQFSRRGHQQVSTFDVRQEIDNTLEFIHYHLRKRQLNVVREFAHIIPTVQADRQQLRQLFLNLLSNAGDATPPGGRVTLRVAAGRMESGAGAVVIEFADTGAGIAPDDLAKIWEPFFTTKPEGSGTGLGLAICRRIVEEHRGTISIESKVGEGTTVRIVLPATNGE